MTAQNGSIFRKAEPSYVAAILAATTGGRLFPLTSSTSPKHTLPVCGTAIILHLLNSVETSGFQECVVVVSPEDNVTIPLIQKEHSHEILATKPHLTLTSTSKKMKITVLQLEEECLGSVDALRRLEEAKVVSKKSNLVVVPGDLVVLDPSVLSNLVDTHQGGLKPSSKVSPACTVLLADVGEQDEHGAPLKESAKAKKGGLARDDEDIEYIALSHSPSDPSSSRRLIWKQLKIDVHDGEGMSASTPKLVLPKPRLRRGIVTVRTDWSDLHVYVFAPWVRSLIVARKSLLSIQSDLVPLLVSRQWKGMEETFGKDVSKDVLAEVFQSNPDLSVEDSPDLVDEDADVLQDATDSMRQKKKATEYAVLAHVQNQAIRAHRTASYLYLCREALVLAVSDNSNVKIQLPKETQVRAKFSSIVLSGAAVGDKVTLKSATLGRNCKVGAKSRLNNVVIMDDVSIGDNCVLQNSIIGAGCTIGNNCSLNDCQVAPGKEIQSGEKAKGELFSL